VVVVINDCNDNTQQIAEELGAKVFNRDWTCHRDQKNIALDLCNENWVLGLDADEEISEELATEIINVVKNDNANINGYEFSRRNLFLGQWIKHGDWAPDLHTRLFRRGKARWAGDEIHDKIDLEGKRKLIKGFMYHYSNPSLKDQINKINVFSDAFIRQRVREGKQWNAFEAIFRAWWRFFRAYFIRLGFLDGYRGFYIAVVSSFACLNRYTRIYEANLGLDENSTKK
jgi:glycosyltransferase involved in cell wall biosynthesis